MVNCGPGETFLAGTWDSLELPMKSWAAWCLSGSGSPERRTDWESVSDVLAVLVVHPNGFATWMWYVDGYPPPPGVEGDLKLGVQVGLVNSTRWREIVAEIKADAESWRQLTT